MSTIDPDAYFRRIGYDGERVPTLETLARIQRLHTQAIPFETLDPWLGRPVHLDPASLERKLVRRRRGGYCYEHNLLLKHVLDGLGYRVSGLAARVLWGVPPGTITPCTHMLLRVEIDGQAFVVDAGFGGPVPTGPLRLIPDVAQETPHEPSRLVRCAGGDFVLQSHIRDTWRALYRFDLTERFLADYEVFNHHLSTAPTSHFVTDLLVARPGPGRRLTLRTTTRDERQNDARAGRHRIATAAEHRLAGATTRRDITTASELRRALEEDFDLTLPNSASFDRKLNRLAETGMSRNENILMTRTRSSHEYSPNKFGS